jgi:hypothetical protein
MTKTDAELLREIVEAVEDPARLVDLIHAYYSDAARAERTDRAVLYIHLGLLSGVIMRYENFQARKIPGLTYNWETKPL